MYRDKIKMVSALLVLSSCAHPHAVHPGDSSSDKSPSELVTEYVNSHFSCADSFTIVKIEGPDSVYTPFPHLSIYSYIASRDLTKLNDYQNAIYAGKSRKDTRTASQCYHPKWTPYTAASSQPI
jgi:hypothetical protein